MHAIGANCWYCRRSLCVLVGGGGGSGGSGCSENHAFRASRSPSHINNTTSGQFNMSRQTFMPIWSAKIRAPVAYIGPAQNLTPEVRRHISPLNNQLLLHRQRSRCNACAKSIQLKPFASCDADHIIAVSRGGKTTLENMQLLCVPCHREKSAREAAPCAKLVNMCFGTRRQGRLYFYGCFGRTDTISAGQENAT